MITPDAGSTLEEKPTLRDVLYAVNACKCSVTCLGDQLKEIEEELLLMGRELQKKSGKNYCFRREARCGRE